MRSGAQRGSSEVLIDGDVAWTKHVTAIGYLCPWCEWTQPPRADYFTCHGADRPEFNGKVCHQCFLMLCVLPEAEAWSAGTRRAFKKPRLQRNEDEVLQGRRRRAAQAWLLDMLDGTFLTWRELVAMGKLHGYTQSTLARARRLPSEPSLRHAINPVINGQITIGHYWYRSDQWPFDGRADVKTPTAEGL